MRIATIVLAAGEGRRMGGPKALLRLPGDASPSRRETFLSHLCRLFLAAAGDPVVAVLGAGAERVAREAGVPEGVVTVVNERWREGMLTSVWCGLDEAEALGAEAVLVHIVDNPLVSRRTVRDTVAALEAGARIAVPSHGGRRGHPAGFARQAWPALRSVSPAVGARELFRTQAERVVHVPAGPDCLVDIDRPDDLARIGAGCDG